MYLSKDQFIAAAEKGWKKISIDNEANIVYKYT